MIERFQFLAMVGDPKKKVGHCTIGEFLEDALFLDRLGQWQVDVLVPTANSFIVRDFTAEVFAQIPLMHFDLSAHLAVATRFGETNVIVWISVMKMCVFGEASLARFDQPFTQSVSRVSFDREGHIDNGDIGLDGFVAL